MSHSFLFKGGVFTRFLVAIVGLQNTDLTRTLDLFFSSSLYKRVMLIFLICSLHITLFPSECALYVRWLNIGQVDQVNKNATMNEEKNLTILSEQACWSIKDLL